MLHTLREENRVELVGLVTTVNETHDRVAMHGVRRDVVEQQAEHVDLPIEFVRLPWPCPNGVYEQRFGDAAKQAAECGVTHMAFGDLFLEDIRDYRINLLEGTGIEPLFPIWCGRDGTRRLAETMVDAGLRAVVTCVDPSRLAPSFAGRTYDAEFLRDLPADIDPCAENGEFHSLCTAGPCFDHTLEVEIGARVERDGFVFVDVCTTR